MWPFLSVITYNTDFFPYRVTTDIFPSNKNSEMPIICRLDFLCIPSAFPVISMLELLCIQRCLLSAGWTFSAYLRCSLSSACWNCSAYKDPCYLQAGPALCALTICYFSLRLSSRSSLLLCYYDTLGPKVTWVGRVIWLTVSGHSHPSLGNLGPELMAGTREGCGSCSANFLIQLRTTCPGHGAAHSGLGSPLSQTNLIKTITQFFTGYSRLCQADSANQNIYTISLFIFLLF